MRGLGELIGGTWVEGRTWRLTAALCPKKTAAPLGTAASSEFAQLRAAGCGVGPLPVSKISRALFACPDRSGI